MKKLYAILNALVIVAVVAWNGYAGAKGLNGNTVGGLSDKFDNLFTPAGYAFSIWSVIFIGLIVLAVYTLNQAFQEENDNSFIDRMSPWMIIANILNGLWLYFWLNELLGISVVIMLGILYSLLMVVVSLGINLRSRSNSFNRCVVFPISIYAGWISVATVANISAYLSQTAFSLGLTDQIWCIIMIIIAALINVYMVTKRNMYGYGFVGIWAILAIAVRHGSTNNGLMITAIVAAVLIVISMIVSQVKRGTN